MTTSHVGIVSLLLIFGPGLLPSYSLGLRGLLALGASPLISGTVYIITSVTMGYYGFEWSLFGLLIGSLALTIVFRGFWFLSGKYKNAVMRRGFRRKTLALTVASTMLLAVGMQGLRLARAIGSPHHIPQSFDTVYHLNLVEYILQNKDASFLHMNLSQPMVDNVFYPNLWHEIVSLVVETTGTSIPVAANWVTLITVCFVYPLGMLSLARVLFGQNILLLGLVGPASFILTQYPNRLLSFGILYPNILSYSFLPALFSISFYFSFRASGRARFIGLAVLISGVITLTGAQPNGIFAAVWILFPLLVQKLFDSFRKGMNRGSNRLFLALPALTTAIFFYFFYIAITKFPIVSDLKGRILWDVKATWLQALVEGLTLSAMHPYNSNIPGSDLPGNLSPHLPAIFLILVGFLYSIRVQRWRWIPFSYLAILTLFTIVRGVNSPIRGEITGYWYGDPQRIAALIPFIGVPLIVIGAGFVISKLSYYLIFLSKKFKNGTELRPRIFMLIYPKLSAAAAIISSLIIVFGVARTETVKSSFEYISVVYTQESPENPGLLSSDEEEMFSVVENLVSEGSSVAGNPWDGSSLVFAYTGTDVVYPHMGIVMDSDRDIIAQKLNQARINPEVCPAVKRLKVTHVLIFGKELWGADHSGDYSGLKNLQENNVADLEFQIGDSYLYKLTACYD